MRLVNRSCALVLALLFLLPAFVPAARADESLPRETQEHLVAAHAKWGVIEVILDELFNPDFRGPDHFRAALSYFCRHVSTIAAPALNRWVIRPERHYLGREFETALDRVHSRLEGFDLGIGFCNSPDTAVWQQTADKFHALIKEQTAEAKAIFRKIPCPRITMSPDLQREVIRDELEIIHAFLVNQDEIHHWTPVAAGATSPSPAEVKRVAMQHAQVIHITLAMLEYVLANRAALPREVQEGLTALHAKLTREKATSLRVIGQGSFDWQKMHDTFHQVFDRANREVEGIRMAW